MDKLKGKAISCKIAGKYFSAGCYCPRFLYGSDASLRKGKDEF